MRKLVIAALIVTVGVVGYLVSRPKKDAPVSVTEVVGEGVQQRPEENSQTSAVNIPRTTTSDQSTEQGEVVMPEAAIEAKGKQTQPTEVPNTEAAQSGPTYGSLGDQQKEERLRDILVTQGSDAEKYVEVQSIVCEKGSCTVDAIAKDSSPRFQMTMAGLLERNPWLGNKMNIETAPGNKGIATFKFYKE